MRASTRPSADVCEHHASQGRRILRARKIATASLPYCCPVQLQRIMRRHLDETLRKPIPGQLCDDRVSRRIPMKMIDASSRIAISALLHDFGKLAERARIEVNREQLEIWKQLDCARYGTHSSPPLRDSRAVTATTCRCGWIISIPFGSRTPTPSPVPRPAQPAGRESL